ncbi:MAG: diguanylate cyclase [Magnetococcales bacterium]|nr:diguanylate cyclase [Magnetococcales bacterium]
MSETRFLLDKLKHIGLKTKTTLLILGLSGALMVVLISVSLFSFRQFSIATAQEQVRSLAEVVRVSLTESMINGVIQNRENFLIRLAEVEGLLQARVVRGPEVIRQFGPGLDAEQKIDDVEQEVLFSGEASFSLSNEFDAPVFRGTVPFVASNRGTPNCLACHQVANRTVLGAITIKLSLAQIQSKALLTMLAMTGVVAFFAIFFTWLFRSQIHAVVTTAQGVQGVVARARDGDFSGRIEYSGHDEVGQIAQDLNTLMGHLQKSLGTISQDVAKLMQYKVEGNTNLLSVTTDIVDILVEVSQFKQSIEEDHNKLEVYSRLSRILTDQFGIKRFTLYEVAASHNHMKAMVVDGQMDAPCGWCQPEILFQADLCRAQRTGHMIDSTGHPHLCNQFRNPLDLNLVHICIPVIHSGAVGNVVQLLIEASHASLMQRMLPFVQVYLRESASVVEARRLMDTLRESALRDPMTGLHNRRFLEEYVDTLVASTKRNRSQLTILMLDIDHFKQVNDTFGHEAGDIVLKTVSKAIADQIRSSDLVIRYGGEEFMVILQETEGFFGPRMAEKIRLAVEKLKIPISGGVLRKTLSIGLARFPQNGESIWEVAKHADSALYQAKEGGRNRVIAYSRGGGDEGEEGEA